MKKLQRILLCLFCVGILISPSISAVAATENASAPQEFTITSEMIDENGNICIEFDEEYGFEGKITISQNHTRANTDDFKLTGRFFKTSDGSTISDYWLSASFYVSSQKVYIDSYDARHTDRTGLFSGYEANISSTTTSGEGTAFAKVRAEFELLLNNVPSPGTSSTYLQVIYRSDKTWEVSGNFDSAETP